MKRRPPGKIADALLALAWGAFWLCLFLLMSRLAAAVVPKDFYPLLAAALMLPAVLLLPDTAVPDELRELPRLRRAAGLLSLRGIGPLPALCALVCGAAFNFAACGAISLLPLPGDAVSAYNDASAPLSDRSFTALCSVVLFVPFLEELTFRGLILGSFRRGLPAWAALPLSAAVFAVCHADPIWMAYAMVSGLVLGGLMLTSRSVLPCLMYHSAFNLTNYVRLLLAPTPGRGGYAAMLAGGLAATAAAFALFVRSVRPGPSARGNGSQRKEN